MHIKSKAYSTRKNKGHTRLKGASILKGIGSNKQLSLMGWRGQQHTIQIQKDEHLHVKGDKYECKVREGRMRTAAGSKAMVATSHQMTPSRKDMISVSCKHPT
jgi:hypothetical protein